MTGLTAAGKTTHARRLASGLGYEYVSGTATLARLCGLRVGDHPPRWTDIASEIAAVRTDELDRALESELLRLSREKDGQVFDVWALAWTTDAPIVRVWLESDPPSRHRKCFVSQGPLGNRTPEDCRHLVEEKDQFNRELFMRMLGFDLFRDHDEFDLVLDNSSLIPQATQACAEQGVAMFTPLFNALIRAAVWPTNANVAQAEAFVGDHPGCVRRWKRSR